MAKPKLQTTPWDAADHLDSVEAMAAYLEAALEEGDPALVTAALADIARARGLAKVARESGIGRERLAKALASGGSAEFATILKVVHALGIKLQAARA